MSRKKKKDRAEPVGGLYDFPPGEWTEEEIPAPEFSAFTLQDHDPLQVPYPDEVPEQDSFLDEDGQKDLPDRLSGALRRCRPRPAESGLWRGLFFAALAVLILLAGFAARYHAPYFSFRSDASLLAGDRFFSGVSVDGVDLSGMTYETAQRRLASEKDGTASPFSWTIVLGDASVAVSLADLGLTGSNSQALGQAYAVGRSVPDPEAAWASSPFAQRLRAVRSLSAQPLSLFSAQKYRRSDVEDYVARLARRFDRPAENAKLERMNFVSRTFSFTEEKQGAVLDQKDLADQICGALDRGRDEAVLTARFTYDVPSIRKTDLLNRFGLLNVYSFYAQTPRGSQEVRKIVSAMNGLVVQAGDRLSFKAVLQKAGCAINSFEEDPLPTQWASCLMEGALCAGLTVRERTALPALSALAEPGKEALISDSSDLLIENTAMSPCCVLCYYTPRNGAGTAGDVTVEWYGLVPEAGETAALVTEKIREITPDEPLLIKNEKLAAGSKLITREAQTGAEYACRLVYSRGGREYRRETLWTTVYPARRQTVEYND